MTYTFEFSCNIMSFKNFIQSQNWVNFNSQSLIDSNINRFRKVADFRFVQFSLIC